MPSGPTERRLAGEALSDSAYFLQRILDVSPNLIYVFDLERGSNVFASREMSHLLGLTAEQLQAAGPDTLRGLIHLDDMATVEAHHERCSLAQDGEVLECEFRVRDASGQWRWLRSRDVPFVHDENGRVTQILGIAEDVTEHRRVEDELTRTSTLLESTFEQSPVPMVLVSMPDAVIRLANSACLEFLGHEDEPSVIGASLFEFVPQYQDFNSEGLPSDPAELPLPKALRGERTRNETRRIVRKDGSTRWGLMNGEPIFNSAGELIAGLLIMVDISDRKLAEDQLKGILAAAPLGVGLIRGEDRTMIWANDTMAKLIGHTPEQYSGKSTRVLYKDEDEWRRVGASLAKQLLTSSAASAETRMVARDGREFDSAVYFSRVDPADPISDTIAIVADITERKLAEEALLRSNADLERLTQEVTVAMGRIVEARDPYTQGHQQRVADIARAIAREMGLPAEVIDSTVMSAMVHDIGKLSVPVEILNKPGALSDVELRLIREHPRHGFEILRDIEFPWPVAECALKHHERVDGSGYPSGLIGEEILIEARIIAVADVIEAMASHRPYRAALGFEAAIAEIQANAHRFDADVIAACSRLVSTGWLGD